MLLLLLLNSLIACANEPKGNWGEALQFRWQPDVAKWDVSKVGLEQFYLDCAFTPSPSDDLIVESTTPGHVLLTDAYVTALGKTCARNTKAK